MGAKVNSIDGSTLPSLYFSTCLLLRRNSRHFITVAGHSHAFILSHSGAWPCDTQLIDQISPSKPNVMCCVRYNMWITSVRLIHKSAIGFITGCYELYLYYWDISWWCNIFQQLWKLMKTFCWNFKDLTKSIAYHKSYAKKMTEIPNILTHNQ